jgi:hypothetical protein
LVAELVTEHNNMAHFSGGVDDSVTGAQSLVGVQNLVDRRRDLPTVVRLLK